MSSDDNEHPHDPALELTSPSRAALPERGDDLAAHLPSLTRDPELYTTLTESGEPWWSEGVELGALGRAGEGDSLLFDDDDIEQALSRIDFSSELPEHDGPLTLSIEEEELIELDALDAIPEFMLSEAQEEREPGEMAPVDPFTASGMFMMTPELRRAADASLQADPSFDSPSTAELSDVSSIVEELDAEEDEVMEIDPLAMSSFELLSDVQAIIEEARARRQHASSPPPLRPAHTQVGPPPVAPRVPRDEEVLSSGDDFGLGEEASTQGTVEPLSEAASSPPGAPEERPARPPMTSPAPLEALPEVSGVRHQLRVGLETLGGRIELREPWARWSAELRLETLEEPDVRRRAASLSLFSTMLRFHGPAGFSSARQLESFSEATLALLRAPLLQRLVDVTFGPLEAMLEALDALMVHDAQSDLLDRHERRVSLLVARHLQELLRATPEPELVARIGSTQSVLALAAQALFCHRRGDHLEAASTWMQCARQIEGPLGETLFTLATYLDREHLSGEALEALFEQELSAHHRAFGSRLLLNQMQYVACWQGQRLREIQVIERMLDREQDELSEEIAARLARLALLRHALTRSVEQGSDWLALEAARAAATAAPQRLYHWLVLERLARTLDEPELLIEALTQQIRLTDDASRRALIREQLSWALFARSGQWDEEAIAPLERALSESQDVLPILLTLGQIHVARADWAEVLRLRAAPSYGESPQLDASWRRADLLEREAGDLYEILALYRSARHELPDSVHLFCCVERALAKLGQWRGLLNLFEATSREHPALAEVLAVNGLSLPDRKLAVELYLDPDAASTHEPSSPQERLTLWREALERQRRQLQRFDEPLLWRVVAEMVRQRRPQEALALTLRALELEPAPGPARLRALLWEAYVRGWHLERDPGLAPSEERSLRDPLRELLRDADSALLRRFALHGLFRLDDDAHIAHALHAADEPGARALLAALLPPEVPATERPRMRAAISAELCARAGLRDMLRQQLETARTFLPDASTSIEAIGLWERHHHESVRLALRCQDWPLLTEALLGAPHLTWSRDPLLPLLLASCLETPPDWAELALDPLATQRLMVEPVATLALLESSARRRDWTQMAQTLEGALRARALTQGTWTTTLSLLHVFVCEWGLRDVQCALDRVRAWSDTGGEGAGELEMLMMLAAWYRATRRLAREQDAESVASLLRELYGPGVLALLEQELPLLSRGPLLASRWYAEQAERAQGMLRSYLQLMSVTLSALFVPEGRDEAARPMPALPIAEDGARLAELVSVFSPHRHHAPPSRQEALHTLALQRSCAEISQWAALREQLEEVFTQGATPRHASKISRWRGQLDAGSWAEELEELVARAAQDVERASPALARLVERGELACAWSARVELALLERDEEALQALAYTLEPAAICAMERRAALERRDWRPMESLELRTASLRQVLAQEPQEIACQHFLDFLVELEPALLGSPWGALRMVDEDLSRFSFDAPSLVRLLDFAEGLGEHGVEAQARHVVAMQLARAGQIERGLSLMPHLPDDTLIGLAWQWSSYRLAPRDADARVIARRIKAWRRRAERAHVPLVRAEILYEVARLLEVDGHVPLAHDLYAEIHALAPAFLPAQISLSRHLFAQQDYEGLAALWSASLEPMDPRSEESRGLSFRLASLYERRLSHLEGSLERALALYERSLSGGRTDLAALLGMARVADQLDRAEEVVRALDRQVARCMDRNVKVALHLELAARHEQELGDPTQALHHYLQAHALDPSSYMALLGILRTDTLGEREHAVRAIAERLDAARPDELDRLSDHLFLLCATSPAAEHLMRVHFPRHLLWRLMQLGKYLGKGEIHEEALTTLTALTEEPALNELFLLLEHLFTSSPSQHGGAAWRARLFDTLARRPHAEGLLTAASASAWKSRDFELLAELTQHLARGSVRGPLEQATELTRRALMLRHAGDPRQALLAVTSALERAPDLLPAVKFAHLTAAELPDWPAVARWSAREAELSRIPQIALRSRVEASEVQRRYLGDAEAAITQLSIVLQHDPEHADAFERLKHLLVQAHRIPDALKLCERQLSREEDGAARVALLNEMADIAMNQGQEQRLAIRYLSASLKEEPRQLRRLRILAELYEATGQYAQALACYDAATKLSRDARLNVRMILQMGHIFERYLARFEQADRAYSRVLELDPQSSAALHGLMRVRQHFNDAMGALECVRHLERLAQSPEELRRVRFARLEVVERGDLPTQLILDAALEVLLYHPDHLEAADILREELLSQGRDAEIEPLFRDVLLRALREHANPPLPQLFSLSRRLHLDDIAFCLAGVARWLNLSNRELLTYHEHALQRQARWPRHDLDPDLTAGVLPDELNVAFFEIVRRTSQGLLEACEPVPYSQFIKRRNRLSHPPTRQHELAMRWPSLLGLDLRDVHVTERLPMGSAIVWEDGARLLLDAQWEDPSKLHWLLVRLGTQVAAWSMGLGIWSAIGREAQLSLFSELMVASKATWPAAAPTKLPAWLNRERFSRWVEREGVARVTPYALELTSRLGARALPNQFLLLELAMERLAAVVLQDPAQSLPHTLRLGVEHGSAQRPWSFLFTAPARRIRQQLDIAIEPEESP